MRLVRLQSHNVLQITMKTGSHDLFVLQITMKTVPWKTHASGVLGFSFACGRRPHAKLNRRTERSQQKVGVGGSSCLGLIARKTDCSAVLTFRMRVRGEGV